MEFQIIHQYSKLFLPLFLKDAAMLPSHQAFEGMLVFKAQWNCVLLTQSSRLSRALNPLQVR